MSTEETYAEVSKDNHEEKDAETEDSEADLIVGDASLSSSTFSNISNTSDDSYSNAAASYDMISSIGESKFNESHDATVEDSSGEDKFNESRDATIVDSSGESKFNESHD